ncbi:MAG: serine/threonine protein kinase [Candidatus Melainabacteria bacterium]|nr:serine/threonine protein kinase [Candidatus Melainabacteria bacterium]
MQIEQADGEFWKHDEVAAEVNESSEGAYANWYEPGDLVGGDYLLGVLIGKGGMGAVYEAEHRLMGGPKYALKILYPHLLTEENWQRFGREVRVLSRLEHANIVKVYNMAVDSRGCPFYVMELLRGKTLSELTEGGRRLSMKEALPVFIKVAEALEFAHKNGVVHRDLKPSNIVLLEGSSVESPLVKVLDFGIARVLDTSTVSKDAQELTTAGQVFGTPYFLSPEQARGEPAGTASDIYSLGCSLFAVLTGRPPFQGNSAFETIGLHMGANAPSLKEASGGLDFPLSLEQILVRLLQKLPANRYSSMAQVARDLERCLQGLPVYAGGIKSSGFGAQAAATVPEEALDNEGVSRSEPVGNSASPVGAANTGRQATSRFVLVLGAALAAILIQVIVGSLILIPKLGPTPVSKEPLLKTAPTSTSKPTDKSTVSSVKPEERVLGNLDLDSVISPETPKQMVDLLEDISSSSWPGDRVSGALKRFRQEEDSKVLSHFSSFNLPYRDGLVRFHFPDISIGDIRFADGARQKARGIMQGPGGSKPYLYFNGFRSPWLLKKLRPDSVNLELTIQIESELKECAAALKGWKRLSTLKLSNLELTDGLSAIDGLPPADYLRFCSCVLRRSRFDDLDYLRTVETFSVEKVEDAAKTGPGAGSVKALLRSLRTCPGLKTLALVQLRAEYLDADSICALKQLETLDLERTLVSAKDFKRFCHMEGLKRLYLRDNFYSSQEVAEALAGSKLKGLTITRPSFSAAQAEWLRRLHPNVSVESKEWLPGASRQFKRQLEFEMSEPLNFFNETAYDKIDLTDRP